MQGYFFPTGLMIALGHGLGGLWTHEVLTNYLICLPGILAAVFLGGIINRKISPGKFENYVDIGLVIIGLLLLVKSGRGLFIGE